MPLSPPPPRLLLLTTLCLAAATQGAQAGWFSGAPAPAAQLSPGQAPPTTDACEALLGATASTSASASRAAVDHAALCRGLSSFLRGVAPPVSRQPGGSLTWLSSWFSPAAGPPVSLQTHPHLALLQDEGVVLALRSLLDTKAVQPLAQRVLAGADLWAELASGESLGQLFAQTRGPGERLIRAVIASPGTGRWVAAYIAAGNATRADASNRIARELVSAATADEAVRLAEALYESGALQPAIASTLASPSEWSGDGRDPVSALLLTLWQSDAVRAAAAAALTSRPLRRALSTALREYALEPLASGLAELGFTGGDNGQRLVAVLVSDSAARLVAAVLTSAAAKHGAQLLLEGTEITDEVMREQLLPELLKSQPVFRAVADILRDDSAAAFISAAVDATYTAHPEYKDSTAMGVLKSILQSRFMLNRVAGLVATTPLGAEVVMVWLRDDKTVMENVGDTAGLLSKAVGGAALDAVKSVGSVFSRFWGGGDGGGGGGGDGDGDGAATTVTDL